MIIGIIDFPPYHQVVLDVTPLIADRTAHVIVGVDDDFRVRECLASLMESVGLTSLLFPSAEEFFHSGTLAEASCLISDVRMPGIDGIELQIRVRAERPELPFIFISGHFNEEIRRKAIAGGAFALIDKPFDPENLLQVVHQATRDFPLH